MNYTDFNLPNLLPEQIKQNEPMSNHTTFKIGGAARFFITPYNTNEVFNIINECHRTDTKYIVIGNGSNLLFADEGYDGVVISTKKIDFCELVSDTAIKAGAGANLSKIANCALDNSLSGFEFASGIPGSLGGAVYMNAGAYNGEIRDVFESAEVLDSDGNIKTLTLNDMAFGYRKSIAQKDKLIILSAVINLQKGDYMEIKNNMLSFNKQRAEKQPIEKPSAGSAFKRPPGHFAGKLIMDCGFRGYTIGGAQVSEKHCGFIINKGGATAQDVLELINHIIKTVQERYGIVLEPEIKVIK